MLITSISVRGSPDGIIGKLTIWCQIYHLVDIGTNGNQRTLNVFRQPMVPLVPMITLVEPLVPMVPMVLY